MKKFFEANAEIFSAPFMVSLVLLYDLEQIF